MGDQLNRTSPSLASFAATLVASLNRNVESNFLLLWTDLFTEKLLHYAEKTRI